MIADQTHPDINYSRLARLRNAIDGEESIKSGDYLIRPTALEGQKYDSEFEMYVSRADFLPVVSRTLFGLLGRAFNKEPEFHEDLDVDVKGRSVERFLRETFQEVLSVGYTGLLADVENERSVLLCYRAEDILDWHFEDGQLAYLKLGENRTVMEGGIRSEIEAMRVWDFDESGHAFSVLWEKIGKEWVPGDPTYPTSPAGRIDFIPFEFVGDPKQKPPLLDLTNLALQYMDASAQFHWALYKVASPTPVISWGKDVSLDEAREFMELGDAEGGLKIGAGHAVQLKDATMTYLEVAGSGLVHLANRLETLRTHMIAAGARALSDQVAPNMAAETARIANSGEAAYLSEMVGAFEADINQALAKSAALSGGEVFTITMSKDFFNESISAADILQLVGAWQGGGIPQEVVFEALRRGEWTDKDDEELRGAVRDVI